MGRARAPGPGQAPALCCQGDVWAAPGLGLARAHEGSITFFPNSEIPFDFNKGSSGDFDINMMLELVRSGLPSVVRAGSP